MTPHTNSIENIELCKLEHTNLRHEMNHLRTCQMQFLTFGTTGASFVLGLVLSNNFEIWSNNKFLLSILCLIPLGILLPSLWMFFDKAKTFNRIVGYYYWIENVLLDKVTLKIFFGWENSLNIFRKKIIPHDTANINLDDFSKIKKSKRFYWKYSFAIFSILITVCLVSSFIVLISSPSDTDNKMSVNSQDNNNNSQDANHNIFYLIAASVIFIGVLFLSFYSILKNLAIFKELDSGNFTDDKNKENWGRILELDTCPVCGVSGESKIQFEIDKENGTYGWKCTNHDNGEITFL
jgi:hypothetical protein